MPTVNPNTKVSLIISAVNWLLVGAFESDLIVAKCGRQTAALSWGCTESGNSCDVVTC
jgi:uncharacterized membrane protein YuzA (DUF378 family)